MTIYITQRLQKAYQLHNPYIRLPKTFNKYSRLAIKDFKDFSVNLDTVKDKMKKKIFSKIE